MKKQEFKKIRRGLGTFGQFKCTNIQNIGGPQGEEEEQETEN